MRQGMLRLQIINVLNVLCKIVANVCMQSSMSVSNAVYQTLCFLIQACFAVKYAKMALINKMEFVYNRTSYCLKNSLILYLKSTIIGLFDCKEVILLVVIIVIHCLNITRVCISQRLEILMLSFYLPLDLIQHLLFPFG